MPIPNLMTNIKLSFNQIPVGKRQKLYIVVKVGIDGNELIRPSFPFNICLVIDGSGSMGGDKLAFVKDAAEKLVRQCKDADSVSAIVYNQNVSVLFKPLIKHGHIDQMISAINTIQADGSTNLFGGWEEGCRLIKSNMSDYFANRVLLLSDGLANRGIVDARMIAAEARRSKAGNISTSTLGVGRGFNEDLLAQMANEGGGTFHYIETPGQTIEILQHEFDDLSRIVGRNVVIEFEEKESVKSLEQLSGYPLVQRNGAMRYSLGSLYAKEDLVHVMEIETEKLEKGISSLGNFRVTMELFDGEEGHTYSSVHEVKVKVVPESEFAGTIPDPEVEKAALLQIAARGREDAVGLADRRNFTEAAEKLRIIARRILSEYPDDQELLECRTQLIEEAMDLELGKKRYNANMRKVMTSKGHLFQRHQHHHQRVNHMHMRFQGSKEAIERNGRTPNMVRRDGKLMRLEVTTVRIGKSDQCAIVVDDSEIAAIQCELKFDGFDWHITNQNPGTPVFFNSGVLRNTMRVSDGDILTVGKTLLEFAFSQNSGQSGRDQSEWKAQELVRLGQAHERSDDFLQAIDAYLQALAQFPADKDTHYFAHNNIGYAYNQIGQYPIAVRHCRRAIRINPDRFNAHKNLGVALEHQGKLHEAQAEYEIAVKLGPEDPRAQQLLDGLRKTIQ